jgi:hypothetical protein
VKVDLGETVAAPGIAHATHQGIREQGAPIMNRSLLVIAVGLGLTIVGCAADVNDPIPPPPAVEAQRAPPEEQLNVELRDPAAALLGSVGIDSGLSGVPAAEPPVTPHPPPNTN